MIVDDEPVIRAGIREGVSALEDIQVAAECGSVAEAIEALRSYDVDLILLDVELPDGSGFDLIRRVGPERMPAVVFVTAYDKYAIQAFEVNAVDYLLKPFDQSRLVASVKRVKDRMAGTPQALAQRLEALLQARETHWPQTLVVRNGDRFDFVAVASVDWIEAANNFAVLHCGAVTHLCGEGLSVLEARLEPNKFVRIHRSYIVNSSRISAVHTIPGGGYELELRDGTRLKSGRQHRESVRKLLGG